MGEGGGHGGADIKLGTYLTLLDYCFVSIVMMVVVVGVVC